MGHANSTVPWDERCRAVFIKEREHGGLMVRRFNDDHVSSRDDSTAEEFWELE
jgi:hypothetical protein